MCWRPEGGHMLCTRPGTVVIALAEFDFELEPVFRAKFAKIHWRIFRCVIGSWLHAGTRNVSPVRLDVDNMQRAS